MTYQKENPGSIASLFDSIATRYDLGNGILSFQLHRLWNQKLARQLAAKKPEKHLDLCAGTGEIAARLQKLLPDSHFYLLDLSEEMLKLAKTRLKRATFLQADAEELPLADASFDAASIAYGIRNVSNRHRCLTELYRTLKPGALLGIVELTRPKNRFFSSMHRLYLRLLLPLIGKLITSNKEAYVYLCKSIETFVPQETLVQELKDAGFTNIRIEPQTFGIATLFFAEKP